MEFTPQQLRAYDGADAGKPIYVAIRGAAYAVFAGRDASRALAKMSTAAADVSGDLSGLSDKEIAVLNDWENKFRAKYPVVGRIAAASSS
ncbi:probable steroid-binding protein 3 [Ananas comosus]|uniref:Probable steroid-binding protein 3 n=1 Tax=Ananas comosus TaxID=4615 RepID=A0A6P5GT28_ANACO|nr:probable steroid-binding protein 3 [Ananas comosus]